MVPDPYWNVRLKNRFANWGQGDEHRSREHTYVVQAPNAKAAGRKCIDTVFGFPSIAKLYVEKVEIWPASMADILEAQGKVGRR